MICPRPPKNHHAFWHESKNPTRALLCVYQFRKLAASKHETLAVFFNAPSFTVRSRKQFARQRNSSECVFTHYHPYVLVKRDSLQLWIAERGLTRVPRRRLLAVVEGIKLIPPLVQKPPSYIKFL